MTILVLIVLAAGFGWYYMNTPYFGKAASGARLERMQQSPNYKDGAFQNLEPTPQTAEGYSMAGVMWDFLFKKSDNAKPKAPIPVLKTDLAALPKDQNQMVWLGHSTYFFILEGKSYLVDPVFTKNASPIPYSNVAFEYTYNYTANDIPEVDYLIITHDHFDHLDYETVLAIRNRVQKVICGLGVGAHFEHWGYSPASLIELDWYETAQLGDSTTITATPARHFSGRTLKRNATLFCSYVLKTQEHNYFIGGDSGYGKHIATIGEKYGPFDWAILENGQYNEAWVYIHTLPAEFPAVMADLKVKNALPVHSAKFALAFHDWKTPLAEVSKLNTTQHRIVTPEIGAVIRLDDSTQTFTKWWEALP